VDIEETGLRSGIGVRWWIAILLCLITTINYVDRQALAVAAPVILEKFGLSNTEFGLISSAFLFAYAIGQLFIGPVVDRLGTKRSFRFAVIAWSIAGILHIFARGFWGFFNFRILLGFTEAMNFPAAVKAVAEWFPKAERSLAVGIVTVGPGLGALISPPLLVWLITSFSWKAAFIVPGIAGFLWLWIWQRLYSLPENHPRISDAERSLILADRESSEITTEDPGNRGFMVFLRYREVWGLMLSRFVSDGAFYFFAAWIPLYLTQERGFNLKQIAFSAMLPFLAADLGSLFGGWLGVRLIRRGLSVNASRKLIIWAGALLVPFALPAATVDSPYLAIGFICIALFAIQMKASSLFTVPADLFESRDVATTWGMFGAAGSFGGMLFVAAAGYVSEHYSYAPIFAAVGIMHILSAAIVMYFIPEINKLKQ
jgi:ACS family hexuronate transporter-like MFS transporter